MTDNDFWRTLQTELDDLETIEPDVRAASETDGTVRVGETASEGRAMTDAKPDLADFNPGGRYNRDGLLSPARACEKYYLFRRIRELHPWPTPPPLREIL